MRLYKEEPHAYGWKNLLIGERLMPRSQLDIEVMPNSKKAWALIAGPVLAFLTYWLMPDQFVNASGETVAFAHAGKACAAVTVLMPSGGLPKRFRSP